MLVWYSISSVIKYTEDVQLIIMNWRWWTKNWSTRDIDWTRVVLKFMTSIFRYAHIHQLSETNRNKGVWKYKALTISGKL